MKYNLSEISALIKDRRTIYPEDYTDRVVHDEMIINVLNSAIWAPTHGMTQPWFFKIHRESARIRLAEFLADLYKKTFKGEDFKQRKYDKLLNRPQKSSVVIAICMKRDPEGRIREIEEIEAVACAVQNMSLHCAAYGLGSFWSSPRLCYTPEMSAFLQLGEHDKCLGLFYIGYPAIEWPKGHRKPLEYVSEWISE